MKILKVIHGYPMLYNAGSEVYSQTLCQGLAEQHEVHVFTREENAFKPDFTMRESVDPDDSRIKLHIINNHRGRDRYRQAKVDQEFALLLEQLQPDVVHIGHLNHLSTSLIAEAAKREIPILYTLHDYWVMCPRGQFMQMHPEDNSQIWTACDGQEDRKCAERCYARYYSGAPEEQEQDISYWSDWVGRRMKHMREMTELVDLFVAPARYLLERYRDEFGLPESKLRYLDYGFDLKRFPPRNRVPEPEFVFGYIGTHIPAKGIHILLEAFANVAGKPRLRIWGRPRGQETEALKHQAANLPGGAGERVDWLSEYRNQDIVADVFERVDAIIVPSVWVENSPLVIHEAQQARVPIITADVGGMAEYVHHEKNGLLFQHRDPKTLSQNMGRLVENPEWARQLGARGYIHEESGNIPDLASQVKTMEGLYMELQQRRDAAQLTPRKGLWRMTLDTNPDTCNLACVMCEEHSEHSPLLKERTSSGRAHREMPLELLRKTLKEAGGIGIKEVIPSTMGEPLLYKYFDEILTFCEGHAIKLNLTTNGTFPGRGVEEWARVIVPVTSDVKISWNGATKATQSKIMPGSQLETAISNLKEFIAIRDTHAANGGNRCRVTLQLTFLETNFQELPDILRLAIKHGVDRVKGHQLWAHFDEIKGESMRRDRDARSRWNALLPELQKIVDETPLPNGQTLLLENFHPLEEDTSADAALKGACPFLGREVWVSSEGRFNPCCAPDAERQTLGEFGDLNESSLTEIWESEQYRSLLKTYRTRQVCQGCNMRKPPEAYG